MNKKNIGLGLIIMGALSLLGSFISPTDFTGGVQTGIKMQGFVTKIAMILSGIFLLSENEKGCWVTIIINILLLFLIFFLFIYS